MMMRNETWRERITSPVSLHYAALTALLIIVAGIAFRLCLVWSAVHETGGSLLGGRQKQLETLKLETVPLRGFDKTVSQSRALVQDFYTQRLALKYSLIVTRLGELEVQSSVRIARVQYSQKHRDADLTEISMDANVSGEYPQIMRFINQLERNRTFFVIRSMALAGQQGGTVNLRLRLSTWLRTSEADLAGIPLAQDTSRPGSGVSSQRKGAE